MTYMHTPFSLNEYTPSLAQADLAVDEDIWMKEVSEKANASGPVGIWRKVCWDEKLSLQDGSLLVLILADASVPNLEVN
jgi:hypothetical protein